MYIVHEIVDKYSNTCHKTNKTKPADVDIKHNEQDPKSKVDDHLIILKYNFFCKMLHSNLVWGCLCDKKSKKNITAWIIMCY